MSDTTKCLETAFLHFNAQFIFLGAFAKLRKATISLVMSVRPSAWNNSGSHWADFDQT